MPDASGLAYAAGFMLATALLHGVGIALGLAAGRLSACGGWRAAQAAGGAMALAGGAILLARVLTGSAYPGKDRSDHWAGNPSHLSC